VYLLRCEGGAMIHSLMSRVGVGGYQRESYWVVRDGVMTNQQQLYWLRCSNTMVLQL